MSTVITITKHEVGERGVGGFGDYDVQVDDQIADGLTLGEMLEQVLALCKLGNRAYPMKTVEEIKIIRAHHSPDLQCPCDDWSSIEVHIPI